METSPFVLHTNTTPVAFVSVGVAWSLQQKMWRWEHVVCCFAYCLFASCVRLCQVPTSSSSSAVWTGSSRCVHAVWLCLLHRCCIIDWGVVFIGLRVTWPHTATAVLPAPLPTRHHTSVMHWPNRVELGWGVWYLVWPSTDQSGTHFEPLAAPHVRTPPHPPHPPYATRLPQRQPQRPRTAVFRHLHLQAVGGEGRLSTHRLLPQLCVRGHLGE